MDMDALNWNVTLTFTQIIAVSVVPIIVWQLQKKYQDRKQKQDAKLDLFLTLMANRKANPVSKEWVDALNTVDVVFQKDLKVRKAWSEYLDSLHPDSHHFERNNSYLLDFLSEMANNLGYSDLKQTEIDRSYSPRYFGSQMSRQDLMYQEQLRVLTHSKNLAEAFSDEEYNLHYQGLMNSNNNL